MKTFIICVSLALALTQVGPALGANDNITALVRGCHVYLGDLEDPKLGLKRENASASSKG
jgi:hypothetical protein